MIALHNGWPALSTSGVVDHVEAVVMPGGGVPLICVASTPRGSSATYGGEVALGSADASFE